MDSHIVNEVIDTTARIEEKREAKEGDASPVNRGFDARKTALT